MLNNITVQRPWEQTHIMQEHIFILASLLRLQPFPSLEMVAHVLKLLLGMY